MPIEAAVTDYPDHLEPALSTGGEVAMFEALAAILRRGSFTIEEVEALALVADDLDVEAGARRFARDTIRWLAVQSATTSASTWNKKPNARHFGISDAAAPRQL